MSPRFRHLAPVTSTAILAALCAAAATCASPVDDTPNKLPEPVVKADGNANTDCGTCDCLKEGIWYRFTSLELTSIDDHENHLITQVLNPLWEADIKGGELNFFMEVQKVSASEVTVRVVNGARIAGGDELCLLPYTGVEMIHPRNGCCLGDSKKTAMNVYAGTHVNPKNCAPSLPVKHAIPVRNAVLQARLQPDAVDGCSEVSGTVVSGSLSVASLQKTCTCLNPGKKAEACGDLEPDFKDEGKDPGCAGCSKKYQNLFSLLTKFPPKLTFKCTDPEGKPAACLTARYTGVRVDAAPKPCPGSG